MVVVLLFAIVLAALVDVLATSSRNHPAVGKPLLYLSVAPTVASNNNNARRLLKDNDAVGKKLLFIEWSPNWLTHEATAAPPNKNRL
eukprot:scaffold168722_cov48-Attheya_sp.AAC.3